MKKFILILIAITTIGSTLQAQKVFYTKSGNIDFFSTTPMENIEAKNNQVVSFIKTDKGTLSFGLLVKSFKFKNALMEEHFNENYAESDKFPKAKFKGHIINISEINFYKNGTYNAKINGELTFHGVSQNINISAILTVNGDKLKGTSNFKLVPSDYNISIPNVVKDKIAKEITVKVNIDYEIYKK